jgi:hypothetical protein
MQSMFARKITRSGGDDGSCRRSTSHTQTGQFPRPLIRPVVVGGLKFGRRGGAWCLAKQWRLLKVACTY